MSEKEHKSDDLKREELLLLINEYDSKIRKKLLALIEHQSIPESFKNHSLVNEALK